MVVLVLNIKEKEKFTMASRLRTPTLSLAGLCMCLALAIIGTGGRSLHAYYHQRPNDPWLLPLWPGHIDSRELQMLIGTSSAILILNAIIAIALLVSKVHYSFIPSLRRYTC